MLRNANQCHVINKRSVATLALKRANSNLAITFYYENVQTDIQRSKIYTVFLRNALNKPVRTLDWKHYSHKNYFLLRRLKHCGRNVETMTGFNSHTSSAVSYTHLDVYKRQCVYSSLLWRLLYCSGFSSCSDSDTQLHKVLPDELLLSNA